MRLNFGTPKINNFPLETNGKLIILSDPIKVKNVTVLFLFSQCLVQSMHMEIDILCFN